MPAEFDGGALTGGFIDDTRSVLRLSGADVRDFLQGLVTNDVRRLGPGAPVYAALLSPQGKFLFDFLLVADGADVLLDTDAEGAEALARRLSMYRLRKDVTIAEAGLCVALLPQGAAAPDGPIAVADPRDPALGLRVYARPAALALPADDGAARAAHALLRVRLGVPASGAELRRDETFILEAGFERLHGVDFRKGCYVGQEVTARMKHKTELRRGLVRLSVEGLAPPPGTEITADGRSAGTLGSVAGGEALALMRLDRVSGEMRAGDAVLRPIEG
ncbi:folate-binding protein YgfZ [Paroceanicella profunda]|uniref:Folate-binding protein YgfZ n=1 Tax=Paroceanicella profunda TaxID=2579971 RepID=A0A5B8FT34_9RHOB|nr:folate-binding protein YgfZ [Paroceanicella profunda]QDL91906.1 folate-binding protein YgfZ [Paroceanicella profunda]